MSEANPKQSPPIKAGEIYEGLVLENETKRNAVVALQTPPPKSKFIVVLADTAADALEYGTKVKVKILKLAVSKKGNDYAWGQLVS